MSASTTFDSHASFLVNAGYSLPVIGALLGHKTPQTTARYAHLADDTLRAAAGSGVGFSRTRGVANDRALIISVDKIRG